LDHLRPYRKLIIITRRGLVSAVHVHHGHEKPVRLHLAVIHTVFPAKFAPSRLEPHEVVGVMDHAHLVRLKITDTDGEIYGWGRFYTHDLRLLPELNAKRADTAF